MIVPYASDDENDSSKDSPNLSNTIEKEIKIETSKASEDYIKNNNIFAFDVNKNLLNCRLLM